MCNLVMLERMWIYLLQYYILCLHYVPSSCIVLYYDNEPSSVTVQTLADSIIVTGHNYDVSLAKIVHHMNVVSRVHSWELWRACMDKCPD